MKARFGKLDAGKIKFSLPGDPNLQEITIRYGQFWLHFTEPEFTALLEDGVNAVADLRARRTATAPRQATEGTL